MVPGEGSPQAVGSSVGTDVARSSGPVASGSDIGEVGRRGSAERVNGQKKVRVVVGVGEWRDWFAVSQRVRQPKLKLGRWSGGYGGRGNEGRVWGGASCGINF